MDNVPERSRWILSLFPVRSARDIPYFQIKIRRLGLNLWTAQVTCIGAEFTRPFYLRVVGQTTNIEFRTEGWVEKQQKEFELKLDREAGESSPVPSGQPIREAFWFAIASRGFPIVGTFGAFHGRIALSENRLRRPWFLRRIFNEFWRTGVAIVVWAALAIVCVALMLWGSHRGEDHEILHTVRSAMMCLSDCGL